MTPLYQALNPNGNTFYAFPSVAQDISLAYQNTSYQMYFSKFVLLNFQAQNTTTRTGTASTPTYLDFSTAFQKSPNATEPATFAEQLVESLRNYVANEEETIRNSMLNSTDYYYDSTQTTNVSEKIFFKWAKKLGVIDFEPANPGDQYFPNLAEFASNNVNDNTYFPEILWRERTTTQYTIFSIAASSTSGFINNLQITLNDSSNFRVGDEIILSNITNSTLIAAGFQNAHFNVLYIIAPTLTTGQIIITDFPSYTLGIQTDTNATVNLIYNQFIQFIGEVNGVSNVNLATRSYTEVYAQLPAQAGQTPDILFRTTFDDNYNPNLTFPILPSQYQPEIVGAENFSNPIVSNPSAYPGSYYGQFDTIDYTYTTANGDSLRRSGDYFGVYGNTNTPTYNGGNIDGITLDFDPSHYVKMNSTNNVTTNFTEFSAFVVDNQVPSDFEFNAILWYYMVQDANGVTASNLYGIQFLNNPNNNPIPAEQGLRCATYRKVLNSTSYIFEPQLDFGIDNSVIEDTFNPEAINSLYSFNNFNTAMAKLAAIADSFNIIIANNTSLQTQITQLTQLIYTQTDINTINSRINTLESYLQLYSTNQFQSSSSIAISLNTTTSPPTLTMTSIDPAYNTVNEVLTSSLYTTNGINPLAISVPTNKDFLIYVENNDTNKFTLPNNQELSIVINTDLAYKQSVDIVVDATLTATQNKGLQIYINYVLNTSVPVQTKLLDLDLPVYYNSGAQSTNSAYNWNKNSFEVDLTNNFYLGSGNLLAVPIDANPYLVANSFVAGDIYQVHFGIGTTSNIDFSGQYTVNSVSATNSYVFFDISNNYSLVKYGASASLPLIFNNNSNYLLNNVPYLDINKGSQYRITNVSGLTSDSIADRYLIRKIA